MREYEMAKTILTVDDKENVRTLIREYLTEEGFRVVTAENGQTALFVARQEKPDLILLDLMMPEMDGTSFIRAFRKESDTPIIVLTAKLEESDKVLGLELGADDYITKPFSQRLLLERIRVLLRRQDLKKSDGSENNHIVYGDIELDEARHLCTWKKRPVNLTVTEFLLVKSLVTRPGHVRTRDQLIDMAYGENIYVDDRTVDSHIKRIRNKFKKVDDSFDQIETLYGVGYRIKEA